MTSYRMAAAVVACLALTASSGAHAQSITKGAVSGHVVSETDEPLGSVRLELRARTGGVSVVTRTAADGSFLFPLVEPGRYELLAERLGYRPVVLSPLPVSPDQELEVEVSLAVAGEVVESREQAAFPGLVLAGLRPGQSRDFADWERDIPMRHADLGELLRLSTAGTEGWQVEGLPLELGGVALEGVGFRAARHPTAGDRLGTLLFPTRSMASAELLLGRPDVEWAGAAGGLFSVLPPGNTGRTGGEIGGMFGNEEMHTDYASPAGERTWRAGGSGSASMVGDSARFWVFGEGSHPDTPVNFFSGRAGGVSAFDAVGLNVGGLGGLLAGTMRKVNAGGSFDWQFAGGSTVDVTLLYGQGEQEHALAGFTGTDLPVSIEGNDLLGVATTSSMLSEQVGLQVRAGYGQSTREYDTRFRTGALGDAGIAFVPDNVQLAGDPAYPATVERSAFSGQGTVHVWSGDHHVKVGAGVQLTSHDRTYVPGGAGFYLFDSPASYGARTGVFMGTGGTRPSAAFTVPEIFGYGQDTWRIAPGLRLTTGLRYEVELLPDDELAQNGRWLELTGIDNTQLSSSVGDLTLVAAFDWNVREQHQWRVRGGAAVEIGDVAPELLGEAITHDGRVTALGAVGDVTAPVDLGSRLTVLSSELDPPMTTRASLGISRTLGRDAALHLDGVIRQTENLPTRADINLPAAAPFEDPYGRPVYGRLRQAGELVYPEPGSNRRFGEFDAVSAVSSDASSTYLGVTVGLEKELGWLRAAGSYTYSNTQDDWLAVPGRLPLQGLSPFPGDEGVDDWESGTSDFDVPHRLVLVSELTLPFASMVTVGAFWRMESGRPFTPGFGRAIDANGDGVAGNDPAFIDTGIPGVAELQNDWDCLRSNANQFAERNSCRYPTRTLLDAWIGVEIPGLGPVTPELRIEALGLDGEGYDHIDTALFIVDPAGTLTVDEGAGQVSVPLRVNPRFGATTTPARELTRFRISLKMRF